MVNGSVQEENSIVVNTHATNIGAPKYIKQLLKDTKRKIDNNTLIVGVLTPHLYQWTDLLDRKIYKIILLLNDTVDQLDLVDMFLHLEICILLRTEIFHVFGKFRGKISPCSAEYYKVLNKSICALKEAFV